MTAYHGGKQRIGKSLAEKMLTYCEEHKLMSNIKGYCEPFCGMLGVYIHIPEYFKSYNLKYKANDINKSVIKMWRKAKKKWEMNIDITKEKYKNLKIQKKPSAEKGFVGHVCSFRGLYFSSYFKYPKSRIVHSSNRVKKIGDFLKKKRVILSSFDYRKFSDLENFIIYCDPPYSNTYTRFHDEKSKNRIFDTSEFWEWCKKMSLKNIIFVSEYNVPNIKNIIKIYTKQNHISCRLNKNGIKRIENLYTIV